jgi:Glycosyl transferase family 2
MTNGSPGGANRLRPVASALGRTPVRSRFQNLPWQTGGPFGGQTPVLPREFPAGGPIRGWADIVEAYRDAVMQSEAIPTRHPRVSICIVATPEARHLQTTVDSVLAQRFDDFEVVIIDGASIYDPRNDPTEVMDERLRVVRTGAGAPLSENFNLAVQHSRGQFIKLLTDNDVIYPHCIAAQAKVLEHNEHVALVAGRTDYLDDAGDDIVLRPESVRPLGIYPALRAVKTVIRSGGNPIGPLAGAMFRRADFQCCGGFPTEAPDPPDVELWTRLLRFGDFFSMPDRLASVRIGQRPGIDSASILSQLAERIAFTRRLSDDPLWSVSAGDRFVGHLKCCSLPLVRSVFRDHRAVSGWHQLNA